MRHKKFDSNIRKISFPVFNGEVMIDDTVIWKSEQFGMRKGKVIRITVNRYGSRIAVNPERTDGYNYHNVVSLTGKNVLKVHEDGRIDDIKT